MSLATPEGAWAVATAGEVAAPVARRVSSEKGIMKHTQLALIAGVAFAMTARADWDISDAAKWVQLPQLVGGYDVLSMQGTYPSGLPVNKVVADDWLCNSRLPVTDIHIWGSWWQDSEWHDGLVFRLGIWSDVPAGPDPSHPGNLLWQRDLPATVRFWDLGEEQFYDPNGIIPLPSPETMVWQYNFVLNPADYFQQVEGRTYWLSVQALGVPLGHAWGWKTSMDHWNDDAAWTDLGSSGPAWEELRDPATGESLDMAFVLTVPEPGTMYGAVLLLGYLGVHWYRRSYHSRA